MRTTEHTGTTDRPLRLLLPIDALDDSRWGIEYALRRQSEGARVEAILLNVGEPIAQWEVLRFRTQQEIAGFQSERAEQFIADTRQRLDARGIACRGVFKQGELVATIIDTAEQLDCDEIVMSAPRTFLGGVFSRGIVKALRRRRPSVPLVLVDRQGALTKR